MREILFAGEKAKEGPTLPGLMIAYRSSQHGIASLEGVEDCARGNGRRHFQCDFAVCMGETAEMEWKDDAYHANVCTSTDNTAGKSRTIGFQLSPASADP